MAALDPTTLTAFSNAAAGHEGVLSDPTGDLIIKPCTQAEIAFYESAARTSPGFASYMPTFMGSLSLNPTQQAPQDSAVPLADVSNNSKPAEGTAATLTPDAVGPMHGKKLDTGLSIVLSNVAARFMQPNILDIKLGARLYDDYTKPEKRARLDKVASETTSSSLGFRIAGMRVWQGSTFAAGDALAGKIEGKEPESTFSGEKYTQLQKDGYRSYNKLYGRQFNEQNVVEAFKEFLLVPSANVTVEKAKMLATLMTKHAQKIQEILESVESRMYSASILFVYEGDGDAIDAALKEKPELAHSIDQEQDDDLDDEEYDEDEEKDMKAKPKIVAAKLIDFAHASWTPGLGPDENALQGVRSTVKVLEQLVKQLTDMKT